MYCPSLLHFLLCIAVKRPFKSYFFFFIEYTSGEQSVNGSRVARCRVTAKSKCILTRAVPGVVFGHSLRLFLQISQKGRHRAPLFLVGTPVHISFPHMYKFQIQVTQSGHQITSSELTSEKFECSSELHRKAEHLETFSVRYL